jgi:Mn2+/Fe2+ NRAMP family transporter
MPWATGGAFQSGGYRRLLHHFRLRFAFGATIRRTTYERGPIKALVWAIIDGITATPVMCFMMLLASHPKIMGRLTLPFYLKILGWLAAGIMALGAAGMLLTSGK